jgi:two-component system sensor histidine kinase KdpD
MDAVKVQISVKDWGPGIKQGGETHLFEKFYRADPEAVQSGVGLGLAICQAIVKAHGGCIDAQNHNEGGAVFRFSLPFDHAPPELEQEEPQFRTAT